MSIVRRDYGGVDVSALEVGDEVVVLERGGLQRARISEPTTVTRVGKRDIVLANGRRFSATEPLREDAEWVRAVEQVREAFVRVPYQRVAQVLAEPLRGAFEEHLAEHRCGDEGSPYRGFINCSEAKRLWDLLPDGDRVVYA